MGLKLPWMLGRETNEMEFMGLGATATIDLEEPSSNTLMMKKKYNPHEG